MRALIMFLTLLLALPGAGQCAQRLVIFGPSSWDTFAPGAPERVISAVTAALDAGFRREHPEVTQIIHDSRGTVAEGLARLRNAQFAGEQIDVIICAANRVNTSFAARGLIVPVDELIARLGDQFSAGAVGNFTLRGRVWAVPLSAVNVTTFFYNKRLFQQAGLAVPETYAEFRAAAPKLRRLGVIPVVHQGKNAWMWPMYYMSALAQTTGNQPIAHTEAILSHRARFTDPPESPGAASDAPLGDGRAARCAVQRTRRGRDEVGVLLRPRRGVLRRLVGRSRGRHYRAVCLGGIRIPAVRRSSGTPQCLWGCRKRLVPLLQFSTAKASGRLHCLRRKQPAGKVASGAARRTRHLPS
jgi:hypothetical protein